MTESMRCRLSATAPPQFVRHSHRRAPLDLVGLTLLMEVTNGSSEVAIGLIDGPVDTDHPDLAAQAVRSIGPSHVDSCRHVNSARVGARQLCGRNPHRASRIGSTGHLPGLRSSRPADLPRIDDQS